MMGNFPPQVVELVIQKLETKGACPAEKANHQPSSNMFAEMKESPPLYQCINRS